MFYILSLLVFGFVVGILAKSLHPGDDPVGCLPTMAIGIVGSFFGGFINWILGYNSQLLQPSGFLMSIVGGVIFCMIWRWYSLKTSLSGPKSFLTGKQLK
jgi:uncharacterized membrane protein YeaQ/YmgE (transglycosylase-associated protein family)